MEVKCLENNRLLATSFAILSPYPPMDNNLTPLVGSVSVAPLAWHSFLGALHREIRHEGAPNFRSHCHCFLGLEVAYSGTYTPQSLGEFRHFLKLSGGNFPFALLLFASQYAYYFAKITAVNLLYLGGLRLSGKRVAIALPTILWGFAMYYLAARMGSLKLPVFTWFLNLIL